MYDICRVFHIWLLLYWDSILLLLVFKFFFFHERVLNFVKCFFYINWDNYVVPPTFIQLLWCITLIIFWIWNHPFIPGTNSIWSWYIILSIYCWIQYFSICWEFLQWCSRVCLSCFSHIWLFVTPRTIAYQAPLCMEFSRLGYWTGLPCPPPGDLSKPGIEPASSAAPPL